MGVDRSSAAMVILGTRQIRHRLRSTTSTPTSRLRKGCLPPEYLIPVMPLDSTQLKLDEVKRDQLFSHGSAMTDQLTLLYHQWSASTGSPTPTLFDAMAVAAAVNPGLCPTTPMRIRVDDKGFTRPEDGTPNADVCLQSDPRQFFRFYLTAVLKYPAK